MVSTTASQQEGMGFKSQLWPFCACTCLGFLQALQFPPTVQRHAC